MCNELKFHFNKNDASFQSTPVVIQESPYIGHWFISCPIYNCHNNQIGYKVSDDIIQQVGNTYLVRLNNTYFIKGKGSISWQYSFMSSQPNPYYPIGTIAKSTIISGTGEYMGKKGTVKLTPLSNGRRNVEITFCENKGLVHWTNN